MSWFSEDVGKAEQVIRELLHREIQEFVGTCGCQLDAYRTSGACRSRKSNGHIANPDKAYIPFLAGCSFSAIGSSNDIFKGDNDLRSCIRRNNRSMSRES